MFTMCRKLRLFAPRHCDVTQGFRLRRDDDAIQARDLLQYLHKQLVDQIVQQNLCGVITLCHRSSIHDLDPSMTRGADEATRDSSCLTVPFQQRQPQGREKVLRTLAWEVEGLKKGDFSMNHAEKRAQALVECKKHESPRSALGTNDYAKLVHQPPQFLTIGYLRRLLAPSTLVGCNACASIGMGSCALIMREALDLPSCGPISEAVRTRYLSSLQSFQLTSSSGR